jgi:hypothetical protein
MFALEYTSKLSSLYMPSKLIKINVLYRTIWHLVRVLDRAWPLWIVLAMAMHALWTDAPYL